MAYQASVADLHLRAGAPGDLTYVYDVSAADTMATVLVAGYFNNTDDNLNLTVGDTIFAQCSDGNMWLTVSSIASGAVACQYAGGNLPIQTFATGTAAAILKGRVGHYEVGTSIAVATRVVLPTPYPGAEVRVFKVDSGTAAIEFDAGACASNISIGSGDAATSGGTGVTYDSVGNRRFTLRFEGESFHVVASSTTRWRIQHMNWHGTGGSAGGTNAGGSAFLTST
jgi:hypothetical protein